MKYIDFDGDTLEISVPINNQGEGAFFLDRDGVIIEEVHLLHDIKDVRLIPRSAEAIRILNKKKIPVIVITNQAVVARGMCSIDDIKKINWEIYRRLSERNAFINALFFCPHSSRADVPSFRCDCSWRKPKIGMIQKAKELFNLNLKKSILVGDTARDILTGQNAEVKSILVKTGHGGKDVLYEAKPDYVCQDLFEAVNFSLKNLR